MDYNELAFVAKQKKMTLKELAMAIGLKSRQGLQSTIIGKTLGWKNIEALCQLIEISPNELMGWNKETPLGNGVYASNISGGNTQNSNESIQALREEMIAQRAIIKEKDKQINRLLTIIEKNKLK